MKINLFSIRNFGRNLLLPLDIILLFPHIILFYIHKNKDLVDEDLKVWISKSSLKISGVYAFIYFMRYNKYYRNIFYYRVGPLFSFFLNLIFPKDLSFNISPTVKIGKGFYVLHPYSTIINAKYIGNYCIVRHLSTFGNKDEDNSKTPIIRDNVIFGANVNVIGDIVIGESSFIGAGAVVTKSVPPFSVVVGNPAYLIKKNGIKTNEKL